MGCRNVSSCAAFDGRWPQAGRIRRRAWPPQAADRRPQASAEAGGGESRCITGTFESRLSAWRIWRSVLGAASRNNIPARAMSGMGDNIMSPELQVARRRKGQPMRLHACRWRLSVWQSGGLNTCVRLSFLVVALGMWGCAPHAARPNTGDESSSDLFIVASVVDLHSQEVVLGPTVLVRADAHWTPMGEMASRGTVRGPGLLLEPIRVTNVWYDLLPNDSGQCEVSVGLRQDGREFLDRATLPLKAKECVVFLLPSRKEARYMFVISCAKSFGGSK